jgi:phosphatidylserine decarboxylase
MSTPSGHAAFLDPEVNAMIKKVLNEWGKFLLVSDDIVETFQETDADAQLS